MNVCSASSSCPKHLKTCFHAPHKYSTTVASLRCPGLSRYSSLYTAQKPAATGLSQYTLHALHKNLPTVTLPRHQGPLNTDLHALHKNSTIAAFLRHQEPSQYTLHVLHKNSAIVTFVRWRALDGVVRVDIQHSFRQRFLVRYFPNPSRPDIYKGIYIYKE
jgi:hypothetical protein